MFRNSGNVFHKLVRPGENGLIDALMNKSHQAWGGFDTTGVGVVNMACPVVRLSPNEVAVNLKLRRYLCYVVLKFRRYI